MTTAYIGLGSNLGNREACIRSALKKLAQAEQTNVTRVSDIIETAPLGQADQPQYLNAVAEINTTLSAEELLGKIADIETSLGRMRKEKWSPRVIDLDLLLFGQEVMDRPNLTVPHPQMHLRSFVLKGLCQLNADLLHPLIEEPMSELAVRLKGGDFLLDTDVPQLVSIAGIIGVGKTTLSKKLSQLLNCKVLLEAYDTNPFLPGVYAGRKELALDSQLHFLSTRVTQLNPRTLPPGKIVISDYVFDKEFIYARCLLDARQLALYEDIHQALSAEVTPPVLTIYLQDSAERCLERIRRRNRPYEQQIELKFLENLSSDYAQLFSDWRTSPVIRISLSQFDPTQDSDINRLANQIQYYVALHDYSYVSYKRKKPRFES